MDYTNIEKAYFIKRINRFTATIKVKDEIVLCHVKNTGRLKELLISGAVIYVQHSTKSERKTKYDLIAVENNGRIVNIDSLAPNKIVRELLESDRILKDITLIKAETTYNDSRFDFYVETQEEKCFIEVKGVTLNDQGIARFPDAPTERGIKHIRELISCKKEGYRAILCFVIQMKGVSAFGPNKENHPEFAEALLEAIENGVEVMAYDCIVDSDKMTADQKIEIIDIKSDEYTLADTVEPLKTWFYSHARILPWREDHSAYRVWVSEIMLQQTRVEAVKPYFERFMAALPNIKQLADIEDDSLMKLWEGLGYYNRAKNLKKAAGMIMTSYEGKIPDTSEQLKQLPGIGSYTAGAIASIAFNEAVPAVDGNVLRVWSRLFERKEDVLNNKVKIMIENEFSQIIPKEEPGIYNQALMELGATVCLPNGLPHCEMCPLQFMCLAKKHDTAMEYPKKTSKKPRKIEEKTVFVIRTQEKTIIRKRKGKGLLAGLYELPNMEGYLSQDEVLEQMKKWGFHAIRILPLEEAKHIFTHVEWHMKGYIIRIDEQDDMNIDSDMIIIDPEETKEKYPIPTAFRAYTKALEMKLGYDLIKRK